MADKDQATGDVTPSPQVAQEQQNASDWPRPGDEGYVHPDGTPQSRIQLEQNRQAAADRAAAGSWVHGAPMATPGPQAAQQAGLAVQRAAEYDGTTTAEARRGQSEYVANSLEQVAEEMRNDSQDGVDQDTVAAATDRATAVETGQDTGPVDQRNTDDAEQTRTTRARAATKATQRTAGDTSPKETR